MFGTRFFIAQCAARWSIISGMAVSDTPEIKPSYVLDEEHPQPEVIKDWAGSGGDAKNVYAKVLTGNVISRAVFVTVPNLMPMIPSGVGIYFEHLDHAVEFVKKNSGHCVCKDVHGFLVACNDEYSAGQIMMMGGYQVWPLPMLMRPDEYLAAVTRLPLDTISTFSAVISIENGRLVAQQSPVNKPLPSTCFIESRLQVIKAIGSLTGRSPQTEYEALGLLHRAMDDFMDKHDIPARERDVDAMAAAMGGDQ